MNSSNSIHFAQKTEAEITAFFSTSTTNGLTAEQIEQNRNKYGFNELKSYEAGWVSIFVRQLKSPFIYLLLAVAVLSFFIQNHTEGIVILVIVLINTFFGFYQEYHAAKTLQLLRQFIVSKSLVIRDGKRLEIPSRELVPGDILILYLGDILPSDVRFISVQDVSIDESLLTGESVPVYKNSLPVKDSADTSNLGYAGTTLQTGKALALVIATGTSTSLGEISQLTSQAVRLSTFEKGIKRFSDFILRLMAVSLIVLIIALYSIKGGHVSFSELILFAIALAVSVIPEALPIVTIFALSQGAMRLAKQKAVVKRLSAIEDLGNVEILCTDKTGTLTENVSHVQAVYGNNSQEVIVNASLNIPQNARSKGFDGALYAFLKENDKLLIQEYAVITEVPFDPIKRRDGVIVKKDTTYYLIMRGSLDLMLKRCNNVDIQALAAINAWAQEQEQQANRVLAITRKKLTQSFDSNATLDDTSNVEFVGLVSFGDPIKKTALQAIHKAQLLNIEIKILSGDSPHVCGAVAKSVGLIARQDQVITGAEFALFDDEKKYHVAKEYLVFARVTPAQKYEIISLLQKDKEVAYMGDGINDAPALKIANVGLAVADAADIAREAADIILLKKSLMVVVDGIQEGRKIFANTMKYIRTTLSASFGNFYALAISSLFLPFLPLLPVQLLLLNFFSDFPMLSIATDNVNSSELKRPAKYDIKDILILATVLGFVSNIFDFIFFGLFRHNSAAVVQTGWFIENILTEIAFIFSIRTSGSMFKAARPSWTLLGLSLVITSVSILLPFTAVGNELFNFVPLPMHSLGLIGIIVACYLITTESVKLLYFRYHNQTF